MSNPHERLRHHVTGAIERGEAQPIVEQPAGAQRIIAEDAPLNADQLDDKYNHDGDGEHPLFTRADWRDAVAIEDTISGYWVWVAYKLNTAD